MPVNTGKIDGRRKLNYASLEEVLADAVRLRSGPVTVLGNWSAGQIFRHLASAYNASIDGFTITFPWYIRLMARLFKKKLVAGPMPAGFQLKVKGGETVLPELSVDRRRPGRSSRRCGAPGTIAPACQEPGLRRIQQAGMRQHPP